MEGIHPPDIQAFLTHASQLKPLLMHLAEAAGVAITAVLGISKAGAFFPSLRYEFNGANIFDAAPDPPNDIEVTKFRVFVKEDGADKVVFAADVAPSYLSSRLIQELEVSSVVPRVPLVEEVPAGAIIPVPATLTDLFLGATWVGCNPRSTQIVLTSFDSLVDPISGRAAHLCDIVPERLAAETGVNCLAANVLMREPDAIAECFVGMGGWRHKDDVSGEKHILAATCRARVKLSGPRPSVTLQPHPQDIHGRDLRLRLQFT